VEEKEDEKECEGRTKCVNERMKHVEGVNNNRTKYVSWPMDMTTVLLVLNNTFLLYYIFKNAQS